MTCFTLKPLQNLCYFSIHSLLYGIIVRGNTYKTYLKRLTTLQNRAVKISVEALWRDNTANCYTQLQARNLNELQYIPMRLLNLCTSTRVKICYPGFSSILPQLHRHTRSTRLASSQYSLYKPRKYKTRKLHRNV